MACLVPKRIVNPHYKKIAPDSHFRLYHEFHGQYPKNDYYITVDCNRCINCFRKYMASWRFRLIHEYLGLSEVERSKSYYVTLTFENEFYSENPIIIKKYVRRFLDRCRKRFGHSVRHFLVTEFGDNTHRLHFHGFFFNTDIPPNLFYQLWYYGFVSIYRLGSREYSVLQEISYCTTYITKGKKGHLPEVLGIGEKPLVLVSPGLGASYVKSKSHFHQSSLSHFSYDLSGHPYPLPAICVIRFLPRIN